MLALGMSFGGKCLALMQGAAVRHGIFLSLRNGGEWREADAGTSRMHEPHRSA